MRAAERKAKEEYNKLLAERNELIQTVTKVQNKDTQNRHELRNKDIQIAKLTEQLKQRVFSTSVGPKLGAQQSDFYVGV
jgi:predicted nuclease with TOPRIM domain